MAIMPTRAEIEEALRNQVDTARRIPDPGPRRRARADDPYARAHQRINTLLHDWEITPAELENA